jgi:hypothetical protein
LWWPFFDIAAATHSDGPSVLADLQRRIADTIVMDVLEVVLPVRRFAIHLDGASLNEPRQRSMIWSADIMCVIFGFSASAQDAGSTLPFEVVVVVVGVVVHNSATKSGVFKSLPRWFFLFRQTLSKQSYGACDVARAHNFVAAEPDALNFNTLAAHFAGLEEDVLCLHNFALSTPVSKRNDAARAQSAGAFDSARWHKRTAFSGESAPVPFLMAAYAHFPGSCIDCGVTARQSAALSELSKVFGEYLIHCRSTSLLGAGLEIVMSRRGWANSGKDRKEMNMRIGAILRARVILCVLSGHCNCCFEFAPPFHTQVIFDWIKFRKFGQNQKIKKSKNQKIGQSQKVKKCQSQKSQN